MRRSQQTCSPGKLWKRTIAMVFSLSLCLPLLLLAEEPQFYQQGFESKKTLFVAGASDANPKLLKHERTNETAHGGQGSESIHLSLQQGTHAHYSANIGRAAIEEELELTIWVKANRPGTQLMARVVLPNERDPDNLNRPLTTFIRGDRYKFTGRWERLSVREPVKALQAQQRLMRAELKQPNINIKDAYIDQVVLNMYSGPGNTKIWIDDLDAGPMLPTVQPPKPVVSTPGSPRPLPTPTQIDRKVTEVKLQHQRLLVGGKKFFLRAIRHTGTPLKTLRDAGFNTVWLDPRSTGQTIAQAADLGFWLVPSVPQQPLVAVKENGQVRGQLASRNQLMKRSLSPYLDTDAVLFWNLGSGLASEQYNMLTSRARDVRNVDPLRPVAVDVWDGMLKYSQGVDQVMLGVHRWPLMTSMELPKYREWLEQRLRLSHPGTYSWTWIQTHLPDWFTEVAYGKKSTEKFNDPIGPQPEQIRLLTYTALASGIKGLGFWSDQFLADSHKGRDRLLQLALLNLELQMLEPLLVTAQPPRWIPTSDPKIKAAMMRTDMGTLVIPIWTGTGSQFVPGQAARKDLEIIVPIGQGARQPWLISPAEVRVLRSRRVPGGTSVYLPEFGLTSAILFTGDLSPDGLIVKFQNRVRSVRQIAAQWSHDLAREELSKVTKIYRRLSTLGRPLPDGEQLLAESQTRIERCAAYRRNGDARRAYQEAQRALRPLRILMRAQWSRATQELEAPVASPYAVSYYTLPQHWQFREQISRSYLTRNVLPDGDFEKPPTSKQTDWRIQEIPTLDPVNVSVERTSGQAHGGKQYLKLEVKPKDTQNRPLALERTFIAVHSPAVKVEPGTMVRITFWAKIPNEITGSADGALIYDSAGGEPLAVRLSKATKEWKRYTLYRRVPQSGSIHVTLGLTGLGQVLFDDIAIEPLRPTTAARGSGQ